LRGTQHCIAHLGLHRQATACIHEQPDAQVAYEADGSVPVIPGNGVGWQAHAVAVIALAQHLHQQRGVGHGACHGACCAPGAFSRFQGLRVSLWKVDTPEDSMP